MHGTEFGGGESTSWLLTRPSQAGYISSNKALRFPRKVHFGLLRATNADSRHKNCSMETPVLMPLRILVTSVTHKSPPARMSRVRGVAWSCVKRLVPECVASSLQGQIIQLQRGHLRFGSFHHCLTYKRINGDGSLQMLCSYPCTYLPNPVDDRWTSSRWV